MNRIDRLYAILLHLQSRPKVTAMELAEQFGLSQRTIYRDLRALEEAGVPLGAEAGVGYFLMEGYHLPPIHFNQEEAGALLTGGKIMDRMGDASLKSAFRSALSKVRAVLKQHDQKFVEALENHIEILHYPPAEKKEGFSNDFLTDLQKAISEQQVLVLEYFTHSRQSLNTRHIEPYGIYYLRNSWHLIAYCQMRQDIRNFRCDRIKSLGFTQKPFTQIPDKPLKDYIQCFHDNFQAFPAQVKFRKDMLRFLGNDKYRFGFIQSEPWDEAWELLHFMTPSLNYLGYWLISYGDWVDIVGPPELLEIAQNIVGGLVRQYRPDLLPVEKV